MPPTAPAPGRNIYQFLASAGHARLAGRMDLGRDRTVALWDSLRPNRVGYDTPHGHTFSLYLNGGHGSRRVGTGAQAQGWTGALSVMPQGQTSDWEVTTPFRFVHAYLPDAELRTAYAETLDRDARALAVPELTFVDRPALAAALIALTRAMAEGDAFAADAAFEALVAAFLADPSLGRAPLPRFRGGLAPAIRRRIADEIDAHLDQPLRLGALANSAGLSVWHFQRMFSQSFGISPQRWITRRRIARARDLLRAGGAPAEIAAACGFASQSHLNRSFRAETGLTPGAWRAAARG